MMSKKQHLMFFTEEEIKALANMYRVGVKTVGHIPYVEKLQTGGGKSAYDKLLEKIKEINGNADRE